MKSMTLADMWSLYMFLVLLVRTDDDSTFSFTRISENGCSRYSSILVFGENGHLAHRDLKKNQFEHLDALGQLLKL